MDLKQLQYFLAVAKHLNFSRAAEALYISQPTLSYQIAELEKELGTQLFIRDRRKVFLTPAGGALIVMANKALECADEIHSMAQRGFPETELLQSLSVAFDKTEDHFESTGVTGLIADFITAYPEVEFKLQQASYEECIAHLLNETLDVAFLVLRHNETLPAPIHSCLIHTDRLVLVTKKDPTVHSCVEALKKYNLVSVQSRPHALTRILRYFEQEGIDIHPLPVDSIPASFTYVQAGIGAIILPHNYFIQHNYSDLQAFDIPSPAAALSHVLAWNRARQNPCIQRLVSSVGSPNDSAIDFHNSY